MGSRSINGLQHILVFVKSAHEAQVEAPELNPKQMSALFPLHEMERKREGDPIAFLIHFATGQ